MSAKPLSNNFRVNKPAPLDDRLIVWDSTAEALAGIEQARRYVGLELTILISGVQTKYWFEDGVLDSDLVQMPTGGGGGFNCSDLLTCEEFTNLETEVAGKFDIPTGTPQEYLNGEGTPTTFPDTIANSLTLIREVRNQTGATLTRGTVVYISGATGNKPLVTKAIATGDSTSAQTFGLIMSDIANNGTGYVVVRGDLTDVNTSAYAEGTQLYLSGTTAGDYTSTKPYAPLHLVYVGIVTYQHPNQGRIEVAIQNGFELDELHDVQAQTPSNRNGLFYDSSDQQWKARAIQALDLPTEVSQVISKMTIAPNSIGLTTAETNLDTIVIPANTFAIGDRMEIHVAYFNPSNTGTKSYRLRLNGTGIGTTLIVGTSPLAASVTNVLGVIESRLTTGNNLYSAVSSMSLWSSSLVTFDPSVSNTIFINGVKSATGDTFILFDWKLIRIR